MASPTKKTRTLLSILHGALLVFCGAGCVWSAPFSANVNDMPEYTLASAPETALPVHVKPGKPQTVHLDSDAARVEVDGEPKNISAVIYDARSIIVFPHTAAGGGHFTVYGKDNKPFMARYVVVGDPLKKYIRLHQVCKKKQDPSCDKTSIYFCPNLCYETRLTDAAQSTALK